MTIGESFSEEAENIALWAVLELCKLLKLLNLMSGPNPALVWHD